MVSTIRTRRFVAVAVVVIAIGVTWIGASVNAAPAPPELHSISAQQLLADILQIGRMTDRPLSFSATASSNVDLGFPTPPVQLGGPQGPLSLLLGKQDYKVWGSQDGLRVANILPYGERDLVVNRTDSWVWDSQANTAYHLTYDLAAMQGDAQAPQTGTPPDPSTLAAQLVEKLAPYATLSVSSAQWVAGEPCYTLVLTPVSQTTLVGSIQVSVDANNQMPLQFEVFARGAQSASIQVGYTWISFGAVDPSIFSFSPPAGANVETKNLPSQPSPGAEPGVSGPDGTGSGQPKMLTFGTGFDAVAAYELTRPLPEQAAAMLPYSGPLASVAVVEHNGATWLLAGAVPQSTLATATSQLP